MSEIGDMWKEEKKRKQDIGAVRREHAPAELAKRNVIFTSHNNGAHLIVEGLFESYVDFWPGTGKWKVRESTQGGNSLSSLLCYLGVQ